MTNTIALIPARGGSKGLPGKNIRPLLGKPLIQYTIKTALDCLLVDQVYVSTDDVTIAEIADEAGAILPPLRPAELASDTASSLDVVRYFLDWYRTTEGEWPAVLLLLQPTSPLRRTNHIEDVLKIYYSVDKPASIASVTLTKPLSWQGYIESESNQLHLHANLQPETNRQMLGKNYVLNGAIYCTSAEQAYNDGFLKSPVYPYIMPQEASIDIDNLTDFQIAEALMKHEHQTISYAY